MYVSLPLRFLTGSGKLIDWQLATLAGLETNSKNNPGKPPIYIHVSGCGITSDNARGEPVENVKEWSDIGLDLKQ